MEFNGSADCGDLLRPVASTEDGKECLCSGGKTLLSIRCRSLPVHTPPSEPKDCTALCLSQARSMPCLRAWSRVEWSTRQRWPGQAEHGQQEGMGQLAGTLPVRVGARKLPNSWEKEILLLLAGREGGEARAAVGDGVGWRLEMSLCPLM